MTVAELKQFCRSNKYKANEIKRGLLNPNFIQEPERKITAFDKNEIEIELFPNPTTHIINVQIAGLPSLENVSVKVIDLKGRQIAVNVINSKEYSIDVSSLSNGVYLVEVSHKNQKVVKRFVKV